MRTSIRGRAASSFRYSPLVAALACALAPQALAGTYVVSSTADSGQGTLRQAILDARFDPLTSQCDAQSVIAFAIPGTGPFVIGLSSPLPGVACISNGGPMDLTIDGYTQFGSSPNSSTTGFNANIQVVIDGSSSFSFGCAIETANFGYGGGFLQLKGVEIRNFNYGSDPAVCGAVKMTGSRLTNNAAGIRVQEPGAVGGSSLTERNVIGGNNDTAVEVFYGGTVNVINNLIGTDDTGSGGHSNFVGVSFEGANGGIISNNTISANFIGVSVRGSAAVTIKDNRIGSNSEGNAPLGNLIGGIEVICPTNQGTAILNNVIGDHQYGGIAFSGVNGATVSGNKIGVMLDGSTPLPNLGPGFGLSFGECGVSQQAQAKSFQIGGSNGNVINNNIIAYSDGPGIFIDAGGDNNMTGNTIHSNSGIGVEIWTSDNEIESSTIRDNGGHGVSIQDSSAIGNSILVTSIHSNGGKSINLDMYGGPVPNDPGDVDCCVPNNHQNYPEISLVTQSAGKTFVTWSLNSAPSSGYRVELFSNSGATAPAGRTYLTERTITTDALGNYTETTEISGAHDFIAATATDSVASDTSEFSPVVAKVATPGVSISPTSLSFGSVPTGSTSAPKAARITSTGSAPYVISLIESGGTCYGGPPAPPAMCSDAEFTCTTTCNTGSPYNAGQSCVITASFSPTFVGFQSSTIYVCDNVLGSPRAITLFGDGVVPPPLALLPSSHDFGGVLVGSTSPTQRFRVSNPGSGPQAIEGVSASPGFRIAANTCPAELAPAASCDVDVVFEPTFEGAVSGAVTVALPFEGRVPAAGKRMGKAFKVAEVSPSSGVSAQLSGRGVVQASGSLSMPEAVDVGTFTLGSAPLETVVDLSNTGSSSIELTSITITGPFTLVNECEATLAAGESCRLRVGFSATTLGDFEGSLSVVTSATGGSRSIPVTARSQASPLPLVRVSPTTISFGERMAGTLSGAQRIVINNLGGAPASITTMLTGPHFQVTGTNCGPTLAAQTECFADVAFLPSAFGTRNAQFIVGSNAAGSPHIVTLNGVGCRPFFPSAQRGGGSSGPNCAP